MSFDEKIMKKAVAITLLLLTSLLSSFAEDQPYDGYTNDLKLLRDHFEFKQDGKVTRASSDKAIHAAHRLFSNVSFLFRSRDSVLEILGDPQTISDYGVKQDESNDSTLVYRFDSGFGGNEYRLIFRQNEVVGVEVKGIN